MANDEIHVEVWVRIAPGELAWQGDLPGPRGRNSTSSNASSPSRSAPFRGSPIALLKRYMKGVGEDPVYHNRAARILDELGLVVGDLTATIENTS